MRGRQSREVLPWGESILESGCGSLLESLIHGFESWLFGRGGEIQSRNPALGVWNSSGAGCDSKPPFSDFDKIHVVAGLEPKLFADVQGEGNAAVEGDHCGGHLEPLIAIVTLHRPPAAMRR